MDYSQPLKENNMREKVDFFNDDKTGRTGYIFLCPTLEERRVHLGEASFLLQGMRVILSFQVSQKLGKASFFTLFDKQLFPRQCLSPVPNVTCQYITAPSSIFRGCLR